MKMVGVYIQLGSDGVFGSAWSLGFVQLPCCCQSHKIRQTLRDDIYTWGVGGFPFCLFSFFHSNDRFWINSSFPEWSYQL